MRNLEWYDGYEDDYYGFSAEGDFGLVVVGTIQRMDSGDWVATVRSVRGENEPDVMNFGPFPTRTQVQERAVAYASGLLA
jgi:hypothetical protein